MRSSDCCRDRLACDVVDHDERKNPGTTGSPNALDLEGGVQALTSQTAETTHPLPRDFCYHLSGHPPQTVSLAQAPFHFPFAHFLSFSFL